MKVILNVSNKKATKSLETLASKKFVANKMASSCLCRRSDG